MAKGDNQQRGMMGGMMGRRPGGMGQPVPFGQPMQSQNPQLGGMRNPGFNMPQMGGQAGGMGGGLMMPQNPIAQPQMNAGGIEEILRRLNDPRNPRIGPSYPGGPQF